VFTGATGLMRRPLAVALIASVGLHCVLIVAVTGPSRPPRSPAVTLQLRLIDEASDARLISPVSPPAAVDGTPSAPAPNVTKQRPAATAPARATARERGAPPARTAAPATIAVPRDPTWYSVRELDELPRPLRPIRPPRTATAAPGQHGRVVLQLAIDESGTVIDAIVMDADAAEGLASLALAAGRDAHFRPGTKGGRIVKSKVLVELTFGAGGRGEEL